MNEKSTARRRDSFVGDAIRVPAWAICAGLLLPTLITWIYFDLVETSPPIYQKTAYGIGKGLQFALLVFVIGKWLRKDFARDFLHWSDRTHATFGLVSGVLIGLTIIGAYYALLLPLGLLESVSAQAKQKLSELGSDSPSVLLGIACFYAIVHSGFEEVYWRGFVFRELAKRIPPTVAILVASFGFMSHHVIVLAKYFGYASPMTYLCALGVAIGGVFWGWLALRSNSLLPSWLSHALVDAAIFFIGYLLVFG